MGGGIAKSMSENMEKGMEKTVRVQREMALKQREVQLAVGLAHARDNFHWYSAFYGLDFYRNKFAGCIMKGGK